MEGTVADFGGTGQVLTAEQLKGQVAANADSPISGMLAGIKIEYGPEECAMNFENLTSVVPAGTTASGAMAYQTMLIGISSTTDPDAQAKLATEFPQKIKDYVQKCGQMTMTETFPEGGIMNGSVATTNITMNEVPATPNLPDSNFAFRIGTQMPGTDGTSAGTFYQTILESVKGNVMIIAYDGQDTGTDTLSKLVDSALTHLEAE